MELLFEELTPQEANIIEESSTDGKTMWLSGVFMQAEIKNRNGRVYPINEINMAVNNAQNAITAYKNVLEINPENEEALDALKELLNINRVP